MERKMLIILACIILASAALVIISYTVIVGATPVFTTLNSPANATAIPVLQYQAFNFTITFTNATANHTVILVITPGPNNRTLSSPTISGNCTNVSNVMTCYWNETNLTDSNLYNWYVWFNETLANSNGTSSVYTLIRDTTVPTMYYEGVVENNGSASTNGDMNFTYTYNITDRNPASCKAIIFPQTGTPVSVTGTITAWTSTSYNCSVSITKSNVNVSGRFILQPNITDAAGNSNSTGVNVTNLTVTVLYTGRWNQIMATKNTTLYNIGALNSNITAVSLYNNTEGNKSYINYVVGVSTNQNQAVKEGESVYVYVDGEPRYTPTYLFRKWSKDNVGNVTLYKGWNQVGQFNASGVTMGYLSARVIDNASVDENQEITYISWYNTSSGSYISYRKGFSLNNATMIYYGMSYWVLMNGSVGNYSTMNVDLQRPG